MVSHSCAGVICCAWLTAHALRIDAKINLAHPAERGLAAQASKFNAKDLEQRVAQLETRVQDIQDRK